MPGMTLIGEAMTFAHDAELLGFSLNNPDEPHGDDFETRCRDKLMGGPWINPQVGYSTQEDFPGVDDTVDEEEGEELSEVRGMYARFCAMSIREQTRFMYDLTMHICALIGVSPSDWEPSDEFILDAIQNGFSDDDLRRAAYAAYLATHHPMEFNPSDEDVDLIGREDDDLIRIGHMSAQRDFPNIGYRFSYKGRWLPNKERRSGPRRLRTGRGDWQAQQDGSKRSRWGGANTESHCPKYGRQDERHQLPRREAKDERAMLRYLSGEKDFWVEDTIQEEAPQSLLSVVDQLFMCYEPVTYENLWELERELENQEWEQREVLYHFHGFTDNRDQREEFTQYQLRGGPEPTRGWEPPWVKRQLTYRSRYWSFGEDRYDRYADFGDCNCSACTGNDWFVMASEFAREQDNPQSLIERFGNRDDDMGAFTGFGESDTAIDNLHIGHSSRPRFTGRYRGLSSMV